LSIAWCTENLPHTEFHVNKLEPPLPIADVSVDVLYSVSVFTHLSGEMHEAWINEIKRVLRPGGLLLLTLHGNCVRGKLTPVERQRFDAGQLVVRGGVYEGSRLFAAFHPDRFTTEELLRNFEVIKKREPFATKMSQTLWVARKL
jgi:SAM-dependent methyltransferase